MSSDSLGTFIHRLSGVYRDPQRVLRDAKSLISSPLGSQLGLITCVRPSNEALMLNDGSSTPPALLLRGTLPVTYQAVTYNIPIDMYLPPPYPLQSPTVFIRPMASMEIKDNHRHVGLDGRVYLPYLHDWRPGTHDLRELAVWMSSLFGAEPPCYARPANANGSATSNGSHNNPPPYSQATVASSSHTSSHASSAYSSISTAASTSTHATNNTNNAQEEMRKALEREISEANMVAETARRAAAEEDRMEATHKWKHEQELSSMKAMATSKVQFEIQTLFMGMKEELRLELKNQKQLEGGKEQIEKLLDEGEQWKGQLEKGNNEMDEALGGLEKSLTAVKEQLSTATDNGGNEESGQTKADLIALPVDTHSAQMLALSAESAAIDDCIYFLDRALVQGSISVEVFLKEVRKLSKRQFMAKGHLIKIAQTRAAEYR
mmetsp:Transcript_27164/g.44542  ORF Transcript_27164/g.44542 Transcript_27164/m.44542 type:complete len:434 (-) Transcript_27164:225-1526(-)